MSIGADRVRLSFNPEGNLAALAQTAKEVAELKAQTAALIDRCEALKTKDPRLAALAQTAYEEAAMWAVKAATAS